MLKRIVTAARDVGMDPERRRALVQKSLKRGERDPLALWRDDLSPEFSQHARPRLVRAFLRRLLGDEKSGERLFGLGDALLHFDSTKGNDQEPNESETEMLLVGFKLIENQFFNGSLFSLSRTDRSVVIHLLTRLAKIKIFDDQGTLADPARVTELIKESVQFKKTFFSNLDVRVGEADKRLKDLEARKEIYVAKIRGLFREITLIKESLRDRNPDSSSAKRLEELRANQKTEMGRLNALPSWQRLKERIDKAANLLASLRDVSEHWSVIGGQISRAVELVERIPLEARLGDEMYFIKNVLVACDMYRDSPVLFASDNYDRGSLDAYPDEIDEYDMEYSGDRNHQDGEVFYRTHYHKAVMPICALIVEYLRWRKGKV